MGVDILNDRLLVKAFDTFRKGQFEMDTMHLIPAEADEVSLLFMFEDHLSEFVAYCKERGLEHLGSVHRDRATELWPGSPYRIGFDVRFEFLKLPRANWRIEAMFVADGDAFLHAGMYNHDTPHVSWKCQDLDDYMAQCEMLENRVGLTRRAEYQNSYGRFSYFGDSAPYFKPRVNLRDQG